MQLFYQQNYLKSWSLIEKLIYTNIQNIWVCTQKMQNLCLFLGLHDFNMTFRQYIDDIIISDI